MKWIDIKKQKPDNKQRILYYDKFSNYQPVQIGIWFDDENGVWDDEIGVGGHYCVTHWMALPDKLIIKDGE